MSFNETINKLVKPDGHDGQARRTQRARRTRRTSVALWIVQALLALLFLFTGGLKLILPLQLLELQSGLPGSFLRFIGTCEVLGAIGLILPGLLRIGPALTPLAAAGLVIIMIGATTLTAAHDGAGAAALPLAIGLLSAFTVYGRWRLAPQRGRYGSNGPRTLEPVC
jgi:hypothetical protein